MADIHGIEVSGQIFGLEDETAREDSQTATSTANTAKETAEEAATSVGQFDSRITANEELLESITDGWIDISSQCTNVHSNATVTLLYNPALKQIKGFISVVGNLDNNEIVLTLPKTPKFTCPFPCATARLDGVAIPSILSVNVNKGIRFVELSYGSTAGTLRCYIDILTSD